MFGARLYCSRSSYSLLAHRPRMFVCVCVVIPCILDVRLVDAPAGSHRRKVTQDFSTFLLRCLPELLSREWFSRPFPSPTVKSNFKYPRINRSPLVGHDFFFFVRKNLSSCVCAEIQTHVPTNVRRFRGYQLNHRGDRLVCMYVWSSHIIRGTREESRK